MAAVVARLRGALLARAERAGDEARLGRAARPRADGRRGSGVAGLVDAAAMRAPGATFDRPLQLVLEGLGTLEVRGRSGASRSSSSTRSGAQRRSRDRRRGARRSSSCWRRRRMRRRARVSATLTWKRRLRSDVREKGERAKRRHRVTSIGQMPLTLKPGRPSGSAHGADADRVGIRGSADAAHARHPA